MPHRELQDEAADHCDRHDGRPGGGVLHAAGIERAERVEAPLTSPAAKHPATPSGEIATSFAQAHPLRHDLRRRLHPRRASGTSETDDQDRDQAEQLEPRRVHQRQQELRAAIGQEVDRHVGDITVSRTWLVDLAFSQLSMIVFRGRRARNGEDAQHRPQDLADVERVDQRCRHRRHGGEGGECADMADPRHQHRASRGCRRRSRSNRQCEDQADSGRPANASRSIRTASTVPIRPLPTS